MKTGLFNRVKRIEKMCIRKSPDTPTWGLESARPLVRILNRCYSNGKSTPRYTEAEMEQLAYKWGLEIEKKYPSREAYNQRSVPELSGPLKNLLDQIYKKPGS